MTFLKFYHEGVAWLQLCHQQAHVISGSGCLQLLISYTIEEKIAEIELCTIIT